MDRKIFKKIVRGGSIKTNRGEGNKNNKIKKKYMSKKSVQKKCPQKASTKSVNKSFHKKFPQKMYTKSVHKKRKVSGRGEEGERQGWGRWAAGDAANSSTVGCYLWPRSINIEWRRQKETFFRAPIFFIFVPKSQNHRKMYFRNCSLRNLFTIDQFYLLYL